MTPEQRIAILQAAVVRANIRRVHCGESIAYGQYAFESLIGEEGLEREQVERWIVEGRKGL